MSAFQILDADGKAIALNELDQQAAEFWGKDLDESNYAFPQKRKPDEGETEFIFRQGNWFDVIGWNIANQANYASGWKNVVHKMISDSLGSCILRAGEGDQIPIVDKQECIEINDKGESVKAWHIEDNMETRIYGTLLFYKPYIELINHWISKGYKPKKIDD